MALQIWAPLTKDLRQQGFDGSAITNHGATYESGGPFGGYYNFDGVDDYISGEVPLSGTYITFSLWVNFPEIPTGFHVLDARSTSATSGYQPIFATSDGLQVGNTANGFPNFLYTWEVNKWYHICVTTDASKTECYINGTLVGSTTTAGYNFGIRQQFTLGSRCNQGTYAKMKACDLRIYNEYLSSSSVKCLAAGLILYYDFSNKVHKTRENLLPHSDMVLDHTISSDGGSLNPDVYYYNGSASLHTFNDGIDTISLGASTSNLGIGFVQEVGQIHLDSRRPYVLSCEAKCDKPNATLDIGLSYCNTANTWIWRGGTNSHAFNNTTDWQKFSLTFMPDINTQFISYCFTVVGVTNSNYTLSIRHCKLEQVPSIIPLYDGNIYTEPDGTRWVKIFHHNNPASSGVFSQSDTFSTGVYLNEDKWYDIDRYIGNVFNYSSARFEFMVKQKTTSDATEVKYRWVQTKDPRLAVYADVQPSAVTRNTSSGYTDGNYGGLYLMNANARCCIANATSGNWFGAAGTWTVYNGGFPGYPNTVITTGYMDIYVRIDSVVFSTTGDYTYWTLNHEDANVLSKRIDSGIQYDLSGFGNHGKRINNPAYTQNGYTILVNDIQAIRTPDLSEYLKGQSYSMFLNDTKVENPEDYRIDNTYAFEFKNDNFYNGKIDNTQILRELCICISETNSNPSQYALIEGNMPKILYESQN